MLFVSLAATILRSGENLLMNFVLVHLEEHMVFGWENSLAHGISVFI